MSNDEYQHKEFWELKWYKFTFPEGGWYVIREDKYEDFKKASKFMDELEYKLIFGNKDETKEN